MFYGFVALLLERLCFSDNRGASTVYRRSFTGLEQLLNDVLLYLWTLI